jgi:hypothetical protein
VTTVPGLQAEVEAANVGSGRSWRQSLSAFAVSATVHTVAILILAFIAVPAETREQIFNMIVESDAPPDETKAEPPMEMPGTIPDAPPDDAKIDFAGLTSTAPEDVAGAIEPPSGMLNLDANDGPGGMPGDLDFANGKGPGALKIKGGLGGRGTGDAKAALVRGYGGNEASEAAVATGLKWLAAHQKADGSWSFDHTTKECKDSCTGAGSLKECDMGATSIALLAFLGGGHTHEVGSYQQTVRKAINYLLEHMKAAPEGGDMRGKVISNEGMYVQGIAGIAICEAHAMTKDKRLRRAAEAACNFIINSQDPKGGGWRYAPRQPGDTSVVGWQVMALKSAQAAKIRIPPIIFTGATHFLDTVAAEDGAHYGYDAKDQPGRPATTAVGLLCRMYLGWKRDNPALGRGVQFLSKTGPSGGDMYYNYYATQVLHHWGGEEWTKWNDVMRDMLVKRQTREGHAAGSWPPFGGHTGGSGGRLLDTCLSVMTLEVYYRHLPIYDRKKVQVDF